VRVGKLVGLAVLAAVGLANASGCCRLVCLPIVVTICLRARCGRSNPAGRDKWASVASERVAVSAIRKDPPLPVKLASRSVFGCHSSSSLLCQSSELVGLRRVEPDPSDPS
jgi:hypothetical protein